MKPISHLLQLNPSRRNCRKRSAACTDHIEMNHNCVDYFSQTGPAKLDSNARDGMPVDTNKSANYSVKKRSLM